MIKADQEKNFFAEYEDALKEGKLSEELLKQAFSRHMDIAFPSVPGNEGEGPKLVALFCEGMIDKTQLNDFFIPVCRFAREATADTVTGTNTTMELPIMNTASKMVPMVEALLTGSLVIYREGEKHFWVIHLGSVPHRQLQESNTEISIKGPKDAFTEEIFTNMSLIRKRMHTGLLLTEEFTLGSLSKTKTALVYLEDRINPAILAEVRKRLSTLRTESIVSSGQLEQWLTDRSFSLIPLIDYIGRPDFVIEALLRGRFAVIVDGSPMVLIGPANFFELLKTPEDVHFPFYNVVVQRFLRIVGIALSICLPGFWIAIASVNVDQMPYSLVATVVVSREGVPLPMFLETFLLLFLFELLREAGVRLPRAVGQTIGIVGGLIIGDSLIRAGLSSPTLLVVIAISSVATYSLVNQSLSGSVSLFRAAILVVSSYLGIYGFFMSVFAILIYFCRLESFGLSFMAPISTLKFKEWLSALTINPFKRRDFSAGMLEDVKPKGEQ
ncbi:spore germination protein [Paenibacillus pinisoli]|uniref:Spore germination protein n=1 Tax=Paenibacillus pinisoli TaxID=1276110 RepID=A0A3A6PDG4_9BACL|nr:spore germination protein [Paenibacillus pinisoli]RJX38110.1 spore germination protein [Paenibacillus pinisoli]